MTDETNVASPQPVAPEAEKLDVTFQNGALARIKSIAEALGVPDERLSDVLKKSLTLVDIAREGTVVTVKKGKHEYEIDLRLL